MGINYDLHLWLYDPDYIRSEIICYKTDSPGETIRPDSEIVAIKPFPYNKFGDINYNLHQFDWSIAEDKVVCYDYEFEYADFTVDDLLKDGYELQLNQEGAKMYVKHFGDIWIGRKKHELET
ncbi:hypothetical protein [Mucilaginibacter auburnensis]|uniref:Uncharacterized protein n=1 Tax=Mucilaginibacter auburnensis TaxID=1457233 RepID=A0A2H9VS34_9SPHI|nr:hypothetical protein [Mucilaginibacter auburnensis]PJJ83637.1 hypothetical protein CLV57_0623 [Mucilaginibacter auburnensis]